VIANLAVAAFVTNERTVYSWDNCGYWRRAQTGTHYVEKLLGLRSANVADQQASGGVHLDPADGRNAAVQAKQERAPRSLARAVIKVLRSIWYDDYNMVAVLPLLPWTLVFGAGRLSYVLATLNIYAIPAAVLLCLFCSRLSTTGSVQGDPWRVWVPLAVILGFPLFWAPLVRGMVDVGILAFNLAVLLIYFSRRPMDLRWRALVAIGLLLSLSVIFRRWNAYWVVSFLAVIGIEGLISFGGSRQRTPTSLLRHLRPSLVTGGSALAILVVIAGPFVFRAVTTNYGDIYDAYHLHGGFVGELLAMGRAIGDLWILILLLAIVVLTRARETRRLSLLLIGQMVIIVVLFARTQSFAVHHYYLLQAGWLIMSSLLVLHLLARLADLRWKAAVVGGMVAVAVVSSVTVFAPGAAALHARLQPLVPRDTHYPLVRDDVGELNRLYAKLDEVLGTAGPQAKFYVASATYELNDTLFIDKCISMPFIFNFSGRLLRLQYVDKRDGFPQHLLEADFVVLGFPPGGLGKGSRVLLEPVRLIREGVGLGRAFEALPEVFHLENGVTARIYKKVRPLTQVEIQGLSDYLRQWYPDRPYVFDPGHHDSQRDSLQPAMNPQRLGDRQHETESAAAGRDRPALSSRASTIGRGARSRPFLDRAGDAHTAGKLTP
jgi:hypothetical protein